MLECPHCYTRVLPQLDGSCPSCQQNTQEPPENRMAKIVVRPTADIPEICCHCGCNCSRSVKVDFAVPITGDESTSSPFRGLIGLMYLFLDGLMKLIQRKAATESIRIYQCGDCGRQKQVWPMRAWPDHRLLDFEVHQEMADEFAERNPQFDPESGQWDD